MSKESTSGQQDPHAQREADKYENPIPSREFILEALEEAQKPLRLYQVAKIVDVDEDDEERFEALSRRMKAMVRDGQLIRNRRGAFGLLKKMDLIKGRVLGHPDGYGFLVPDEGGKDLFLSEKEMHKVLHGDIVIASVIGEDRRGRQEGAIVEVTEHNTTQVLGRLNHEDGLSWVRPNNNRLTQDIFIPKDGLLEAKEEQVVLVEVLHQPTARSGPIGKIVDVVGDYMSAGMEIESAIHAYGIPNSWNEELEAELAKIPDEVIESDLKDRKDLRGLQLVTIDGSDTKDFDDAVFAKRRKNGWRLVVAIADVSHYVKPGTELDKEAFKRGNSVYFPQRVVPMLPSKLSDGLCSLNPHVDRLCMVADLTITEDGKLEKSQFYQAVMNSKARLTYTQVHEMLTDNKSKYREEFADQLSNVEELYNLYKVLKVARAERGALEFETTETRMVFDENRKIQEIVPVYRNDAHKLIEECMLMANVATARYLKWHKMPILYRVHEKPLEERLKNLRTFLGDFGLTLEGGDEPTAHDYAKVSEQVAGEPHEHLVQTVLLRSMNQAVYQPENKGHFGLNYEHYAHFTSPIRRYPDLLIHRALRHVWTKKGVENFDYNESDMVDLGQHCSDTERRADEATRDSVTFLKCEFLSHRIGEEYEAVVSAATNFGLFVELQPLFVEGLVHITELGEDYFHYDNARHCLKGERTGKVYRLGDRIKVQVAQVNLDDRKVDLRFIESLTEHAEPEATGSDIEESSTDEQSSDEAKPARKKRYYRKKKRSSSKPKAD
ncbi:ribonuclease R [Thiomicrorhabdus lithotrophica]|uniref:Ribonuclease R n=1 Tax=Thiomicrorhabdus lithotrophica TaxID=2949997 RepID=A0ABY8CBH4_9GAMM|nr:ribonuclease R [Thiomicrorhabdus lithotrophica]WEJ63329.1 ribonuclease R [Thiomicrorhabdus lithotrophica]